MSSQLPHEYLSLTFTEILKNTSLLTVFRSDQICLTVFTQLNAIMIALVKIFVSL